LRRRNKESTSVERKRKGIKVYCTVQEWSGVGNMSKSKEVYIFISRVENRGVGGNNKSNNSKVYLNQEEEKRKGEGEKGVKRQKRKKRRVTHNFFLHMTFLAAFEKVHSNRTSIMKLEKGCQ
jgi:hypothetical protein